MLAVGTSQDDSMLHAAGTVKNVQIVVKTTVINNVAGPPEIPQSMFRSPQAGFDVQQPRACNAVWLSICKLTNYGLC
jgi:hypothetical protein